MQIRGVIGHKHFACKVAMECASQSADGQFRSQQFLSADGPQADNVFGPEKIELLLVERAAVGQLVAFWVSVTRGPAFDRVEDVDLVTLQGAGLHHFGEQVSGYSHKRLTDRVFFLARPFSDKGEARTRIALSKYGLGSAACECGT